VNPTSGGKSRFSGIAAVGKSQMIQCRRPFGVIWIRRFELLFIQRL